MDKLVLATHNQGKVNEMKSILNKINIEVLSISDIISVKDIVEDANTLEGNAKIKAEYIHKLIGGYTLADDTGLFVTALNGEPGIHTARYAGEDCSEEDNRKKLLKSLKEWIIEAIFKTVLFLIDKNGKEYCVEGICEGNISETEKGNDGFGYDKVFIPKGYSRTFAEMGLEEKNILSHRAKALGKLKILLMDVLNESSNN